MTDNIVPFAGLDRKRRRYREIADILNLAVLQAEEQGFQTKEILEALYGQLAWELTIDVPADLPDEQWQAEFFQRLADFMAPRLSTMTVRKTNKKLALSIPR